MNVHGLILPSRIIGVLFVFFAILFAGIALWLYSSSAAAIRAATRVTGTIVELKETSDDNGPTYTPVFRFRDDDGRDQVITSN